MNTTTRPTAITLIILVAALTLFGCTGGQAGASPANAPVEQPSRTLPPIERASPSTGPAVVGEVPPAIAAEARSMLATQLGPDAAASAELVVAEAVTWPDGALGCPEPGMFYTQMVVPGYRIVFEVDGKRYDYRASRDGSVRACTLKGPRAS
jgi:hypothetical protein